MLNSEPKNILLPSIVLALVIHMMAFQTISSFLPETQLELNGPKVNPPSIFKIKKIPKKKLNKFKTVGIKDGKKGLSYPLKFNKKVPIISKRKKNLSLTALGPKNKEIISPKKVIKANPKRFKLSPKIFDGAYLKIRKEEQLRQNRDQKNILSQLSVPNFTDRTLRKSALNIRFDPPEGVKVDELNTREKKFYSFTKRSYETYVHSVIRALNNILKIQPQFKNLSQAGKHHLTGRIIFDEKGNAVSVKFIKTSQNDAIQDFFVKALVDIRILQNPPKELLDKEKNFTIYYQLMIGN